MKFIRCNDYIVEGSKDCEKVIENSILINYNQITYVQILDNFPYFTVYFSNGKFVEIDKIHLEKFLEGVK